MSLETDQILLQDIGLSATISVFTTLGAKGQNRRALWRLFLAHELLGGCPPHARGGVRPPPEASPHARGGVPTPSEASPHARGGVGRGEKCAPLPGSDVRLLFLVSPPALLATCQLCVWVSNSILFFWIFTTLCLCIYRGSVPGRGGVRGQCHGGQGGLFPLPSAPTVVSVA